MRMTVPAVSGAAVFLAFGFVLYLGPDAAPPDAQVAVLVPEPAVATAAPVASVDLRAAPSANRDAPAAAPLASSAPSAARAPLPGEAPITPMTQLIADRQQNVIVRQTDSGDAIPPGLREGELEFAAEPVDAAWAPGAEADLLAKFAQVPGLKLIDLQVECRTTMCRLQLTQPREAPPERGAPSSPRPFNLLRESTLADVEARWMMVTADATGPMRSVAYFWREGYARRECYEDRKRTPCATEPDESGN